MRWEKTGFIERLQRCLPCAIFLLVFALRIKGNAFGFPYFFHPDETKLTTLAWKMAEGGSLNPESFFYPTGFPYLLLIGFKFISLFGLNFHSYHADLITLHWLGRFYSALFGAGTVLLIYELSRRLCSFSAGIAASVIMGFNFIHLKYSHYATTDITSLFFILLSLFFVCRYEACPERNKGKAVMIFIAPFLGGVATGIKYSAWPIIFPILFSTFLPSHLGRPLYQRLGRMVLLYLIGFLFTTPFAFIDLRNFLPSLVEILVIPRSYWLGLTHPSLFYYFYDFRPIAGVGMIFIFSILGLISRIKHWSSKDTVLISFFLPYMILASLSLEKIDRFFLPGVPIFILWAGVGINNTAQVISRLKGNPTFILCMLVILVSISPFIKAIRYVTILEGKDNRIIASQWIRENIPLHSNLALFSHHWADPPLESGEYKITSIPLVYKNKDIDREKFKLHISRNRFIANIIEKVFGEKISPEIFLGRINRLTPLEEFALLPLTYFQERGVDYIIISGIFREDLLDKDTAVYFPKLNSSSHSFFNELERKAKLVYSLPSVKGFGKDFALSPSIDIYRLK